MSGTNEAAVAGRSRASAMANVVRVWQTLVGMLRARPRVSARRQLAAMTERELLDCGMSRTEIEYELRRPRRRK